MDLMDLTVYFLCVCKVAATEEPIRVRTTLSGCMLGPARENNQGAVCFTPDN